jgi:predicted ester cyclase
VGYLHEDVVVHATVGLSTVGLANERQSWREAKAAMPDIHHDILEVLADGHTVAARCVVSGTLQGTYGGISAQGKRFSVDQAVFAHLRDGKIGLLCEIVDTVVWLTQLGALPE